MKLREAYRSLMLSVSGDICSGTAGTMCDSVSSSLASCPVLLRVLPGSARPASWLCETLRLLAPSLPRPVLLLDQPCLPFCCRRRLRAGRRSSLLPGTWLGLRVYICLLTWWRHSHRTVSSLRPKAGHVLCSPGYSSIAVPGSRQAPPPCWLNGERPSACFHPPLALAQPPCPYSLLGAPQPLWSQCVFLSFSCCAVWSYRPCPHPMASHAGALPLNPLHHFLWASQLLFCFKKWSVPQKPYCSKLHLFYMLVLAWYLHFNEHSLGEVKFCIVEDIVSRCADTDPCGLLGCVMGPPWGPSMWAVASTSLKHPSWPCSLDSHRSLRKASLLEKVEAWASGNPGWLDWAVNPRASGQELRSEVTLNPVFFLVHQDSL